MIVYLSYVTAFIFFTSFQEAYTIIIVSQVIGIAEGLEYLHGRDVIHANLKGVRHFFACCMKLVCSIVFLP